MFYLLDKPKGISSFKAIKNFASENNIKKIGHTGTLDPLATGLLLTATDDDTKLIDYVDKGFKTYTAQMQFGKTSDTYDSEGVVVNTGQQVPDEATIIESLIGLVGHHRQMPPAFSAKKIDGVKAYELARQGKEVKLKLTNIEILEVMNISKISNTHYKFDITVSRGTYIRSIIHDLGVLHKCGAIMTELDRISIGILTKDMAGQEVDIKKLFILPTIFEENIKDLLDGKSVPNGADNGKYGLLYKNDIIGIVVVNDNMMKGKKMLGNKLKGEV